MSGRSGYHKDMTRLERELLRLRSEAAWLLAMKLDPWNRMTAQQAYEHDPEGVRRQFDRLVSEDVVVLDLLWNLTEA
jgi:hypothetical protein